nr:TonB-dependent receptor [uncultured Duganella sp.]
MQRSNRRNAPRLLSLPATLLGCCVLTAAALPALPARAQQATPSTDTEAPDADAPPAIVITAQRDQAETGFKADRSDTATRSGASLHDVPGSVTIITGKLIESQQQTNLQDVLRNVSGIQLTQTPMNAPTFQVRGFVSTGTTNGVADATAASTNVFGVERVEVLKGPQAILSGSNSLGGGVNVVVKKPQAESIRDLTLQYGSGGDKTGAGDLSGALTADKKLTYRVIGAKSRADHSDVGFDGRRDDYFMPALRWKDASTDIIVGLSYGKQHTPVPGATFARRDGVILPRPPNLLAAPTDGFDGEQKKAFYQLEQRLTSNLMLISRLQRTLDTLDLHVYSPGGLSYASGAARNNPRASMNFNGSRSVTDTRTTSGDHYLRASFETWGARHKLSVGFNHIDTGYGARSWEAPALVAYPYGGGSAVIPDATTAAVKPSSLQSYKQNQKGFFVQELASLGKWDLLLNARRTLYEQEPSFVNYLSANFVENVPRRKIYATTPGGGIVYKATSSISLYASYAEGFIPQTSARCGGGLVPPIETVNKEVGAKFDLLDSRLMLTTSAFTLAQSNQIRYQPLGACFDVRDSQKTRGLEVDVQGQLARGWDVIANYTWNTVRDVGDPNAVYPGVPRNKAALWTTYSFQGAALKGLGAGIGLTASSSAPGGYNTVYPFTLPGQAQIDANVNWHGGPWSVVAGVKNLADRVLYGSSGSSTYVPLLPGRQYMLTVKRSFQ